MATSALIRFQGLPFGAVVRVHWDGDRLAPWLIAFNKRFAHERGDDPTYKVAQLLRDSVRQADEYKLDPSEFTGWAVMNGSESDDYFDVQHVYTLRRDGEVVQKVL